MRGTVPAGADSRRGRGPSAPGVRISWPGRISRVPRSEAASAGKYGGKSEGGAVGQVAAVADVQVALSTASVYPERTADAFEAAARLGYDGIEVMVTMDLVSQDLDVLRRLSDYHGVPVLAVHAPCLLITQRVWGRDPWGKLDRAREVAEKLGAKVVVVHPPFRWQRDYAREFEAGLTPMGQETDGVLSVGDLYPRRAAGVAAGLHPPASGRRGAGYAAPRQAVRRYASSIKVTGPSLTSVTCMSAPNTPVRTLAPSSRSASAKAVTSGSATGPGAAACQVGRRPFLVSAYRVNWLITSSGAPVSAHDFSSRRIRRW